MYTLPGQLSCCSRIGSVQLHSARHILVSRASDVSPVSSGKFLGEPRSTFVHSVPVRSNHHQFTSRQFFTVSLHNVCFWVLRYRN